MAYCSYLLIFLCITSIVAKKHEDVVKETQEALKKAPQAKWTAGVNNAFKGKDVKEIAKLNGYGGGGNSGAPTVNRVLSAPPPTKPQIGRSVAATTPLPDTFDWRTATNGQSVGHIRDQRNCGSCWAVSSSSVMSDRLFLWTNQNVFLSAKHLMECVGTNICGGNFPSNAMQYAINNGIATGGDPSVIPAEPLGCLPYSTWNAKCNGKCANNVLMSTNDKFYAGGKYYTIYTTDPQLAIANNQKIMQELYNYGPVVVGFTVYEDFQSYKSGVYRHVNGMATGRHAVRVIGWGTESGQPYWLCANSWGTSWGDNGYFKILRGSDECAVEEEVTAVYPKEAY